MRPATASILSGMSAEFTRCQRINITAGHVNTHSLLYFIPPCRKVLWDQDPALWLARSLRYRRAFLPQVDDGPLCPLVPKAKRQKPTPQIFKANDPRLHDLPWRQKSSSGNILWPVHPIHLSSLLLATSRHKLDPDMVLSSPVWKIHSPSMPDALPAPSNQPVATSANR